MCLEKCLRGNSYFVNVEVKAVWFIASYSFEVMNTASTANVTSLGIAYDFIVS